MGYKDSVNSNDAYNKLKTYADGLDTAMDARVDDLEEKAGCFAYLPTAADTTITTGGTYYPVAGTFTNAPCQSFDTGTEQTPSIKYTGTTARYFEIDWHASCSADNATTTVTFAIYKYDASETTFELIASSVMSTLCKNADELYALSGSCVVELDTDDEVQLVVTSDGDGDVITVNNYITSITRFFNN